MFNSFRSNNHKNLPFLFLEKYGFTTPHNSFIFTTLSYKITLSLPEKITTNCSSLTSKIIRSFFIITPPVSYHQ